ncbi:hypothetical protein [Larkinella terrae]|uniref:Uncharacterized protein n=1 Tax=Larkinella terrae TaxID=2025311 RepID=A0A7K0ENZ2_9BACT|nr:hypothetical protein [Larkinella terrae]MRS63216.1 hypothetical protein [Larkinella terrae]
MKTATKQTVQLPKPTVTTDPILDEVFGDSPLFPEKLKQAEEQIHQHGLPKELYPLQKKQK